MSDFSDIPIIRIRHLTKCFHNGEDDIDILKGIDLDIYAGELVAIIGASGSGKSTLMNILGCLDTFTAGTYEIDGVDVESLSDEERASLRRESIGFIFQSYHLLGDLNAYENVAVPAVYAGVSSQVRIARAIHLLTRLGLGERTTYYQTQLSGGQQQRVSIARALMNGGRIIFADEPTGALDSVSSAEVMQILRELNDEGHTIILVTHDPNVAAIADRVIELKDGVIISDRLNVTKGRLICSRVSSDNILLTRRFVILERFFAAFMMALKGIWGHKLRALLTMLGIVIGIASVVSVVALGEGAKKRILGSISELGTNTIRIYRGRWGGVRVRTSRVLTAEDAKILAQQAFIQSATPSVNSGGTLRYGDKEINANVVGVGAQFFDVENLNISKGRPLRNADVEEYAPVAYLSTSSAVKIFGHDDPIGKIVLIGNLPVKIIGIIDHSGRSDFGASNQPTVWMPYTSVMGRMLGQKNLSSIVVRISDNVPSASAENAIKKILTLRHGSEDFTIMNSDAIRQAVSSSVYAMQFLISSIAFISLVVGGIGVMNIMLVSVTERTSEIGIRRAVGARKSDIMSQFLIESTLLCLIGGK